MTIPTILGLLLLGVAAGSLSGLVGVGGGIVIVPALVLGFGMSQHTAQGTSLAVLAMPVVGLGAYQYYRNGHIDIPTALVIGVGFVIGGMFGGKLANALPADTIRKVFACVLLAIGTKLLFFGR
jgi:uncharacterized protein